MYKLFIPYLCRPDLLKISYDCAKDNFDVIIINNSGSDCPYPCYTPPFPFNFVESMNIMQFLAKDDPFFFWCHSDAKFPPEVCTGIIKEAEHAQASNKKWGVIFTKYDLLCCYNTECCKTVGTYDCFFNSYTSDCDWYRRVRLAGYQEIPRNDLGDKIQHMEGGSSTIKSLPLLNAWVQRNMKHWNAYYAEKWGGKPGQETFSYPFNNAKYMHRPNDIENAYLYSCAMQTDVSEHLPTLFNLTKECKHVTEFGRGFGCSTVAFIAAKPDKFISYDFNPLKDHDSWLMGLSDNKVIFVNADTRTTDIEETDLIFIDTDHNYNHLKLELKKNGNKSRKYLVFHDSITFGQKGTNGGEGIMFAIEEFVALNPWWIIHEHHHNNNGLLILKRI